MGLFTQFAISVLDGLTTNNINDALKNETSEIDRAYDDALEKTIAWYEGEYRDHYGNRNDRFFDYLIAADALEKTLLVENPTSADEMAERLYQKHRRKFPPDIIAAFQRHLIDVLENDPATAPLLRAIRNSAKFSQMAENTGQAAANTESTAETSRQILNLLRKITGDSGPLSPPGSPDFEPLDWRVVYQAFKSRELDVIEVKYVSDKMGGPKYLP
ncbi:MAG: hypothetical protein DSY89_10555, partial [Deltaproteobacteria bacterium]